MTEWNIASRSPEEQEKTAVDLLAAGMEYRLRMKQPVIPEQVMRRQPAHLQTYFMEWVNHHLDFGWSQPTKLTGRRYPVVFPDLITCQIDVLPA